MPEIKLSSIIRLRAAFIERETKVSTQIIPFNKVLVATPSPKVDLSHPKPVQDCEQGARCDEVYASAWYDKAAKQHYNECTEYCQPWGQLNTKIGVLRR